MPMTNNDILRRLRFALNLSDSKLVALFALVHQPITEEALLAMLKKDDEPGFRPCTDKELCQFLDGLVIERRGLRPGDGVPAPTPLDNNLIFKKIRIALELKEEDILAMLTKAGFALSKSELGAIFRNPDHRHYRPCGNQLLRNFLKGLSISLRGR
ncbi:DUF1456 family protein [Shewanella sp. FJAT-52076]|uniref:DUF1456 family protein n=1 Tax=Shewanella sp. FJAT-52076 TaxID=2864202 RepID=UPI001C661AF9|nr:DUF1456 family protein [Shewanella sp. FJAT-52076]QYJ74409.1 DUF1456 family protein [Shewanella sp. FJAT-52076]